MNLSNLRPLTLIFFAAVLPWSIEAAILVSPGSPPLPIVLPPDAPEANRAASAELATIIETKSGVRPEIIAATPESHPAPALWVGLQDGLEARFPGVDLDFRHPEEIHIVATESDVLVGGRDRVFGDRQTEFGTANAVYTFLQNQLGVRWLWPGELGLDIPQSTTVAVDPVDFRFHPVFRQRKLRFPRNGVDRPAEANAWWNVHQRGRGSLEINASHAFTKWWDRFSESHPEWFAMKPDGTRGAFPNAHGVKLSVSNPEVARQWIEDAAALLEKNPDLLMVSAAPNDGGGWCVSPESMAWDHPDGPQIEIYGRPYVSLTDRYVRFWNLLGKGLKERFPDREVMVGTIAYSAYRNPPVGQTLEDNIAIGFVGGFPTASKERDEKDKEQWRAWADKAALLYYRPNVFLYSGSDFGFPTVVLDRTIRDFRFLAENKCVGLDVDSVFLNYATQGPQLYLMAQLAYDPLQDGKALLEDYFRRGFGPAALEIEAYFKLLEDSQEEILADENYTSGSGARLKLFEVYPRVYSENFFQRGNAYLEDAEKKTLEGPEVYRERVAFIRDGYRFLKTQVELIVELAKVRAGGEEAGTSFEKAVELSAERDRLMQESRPFALDHRRIASRLQGNMLNYLGPPDDNLLSAATGNDEGNVPQYLLAPPEWKPAFSDNFQRAELGPNWEVIDGTWSIDNGAIVTTSGGAIAISASFSGLQKIEFEARADTEGPASGFGAGTAARPSDLSVSLHNPGHSPSRQGYFLQFGGRFNTVNALRKAGTEVQKSVEYLIDPQRTHRISAEVNNTSVRLEVDGNVLIDWEESSPLLGEENDRIVFYFFQPARMQSVRVFTAEPKLIPNPDWDPLLHDPDRE